MKPQRNRLTPRFELARAMRVAARNIDDGQHCRIAARAADRIPRWSPEKFNRGWGVMAAMGRVVMRSLPLLPSEQRAEAAAMLLQCADVVEHGATTVSETSLAEARRHRRRA